MKTDAALNTRCETLDLSRLLALSASAKLAKLGALQPKTSLDQTACDLESSNDFKTAALLKLNAIKSYAILSRYALMPHILRRFKAEPKGCRGGFKILKFHRAWNFFWAYNSLQILSPPNKIWRLKARALNFAPKLRRANFAKFKPKRRDLKFFKRLKQWAKCHGI